MMIRIFLFIIFIPLLFSCSDKKQEVKSVDITLAAEISLLPATVWIAENQDFFKKHQVNLIIKEFDSGRNALETMLKDDSIDISTVAQTPIVFNSFHDESYVIIATMAYSVDDIKVLARKDRGILKAEDLKGKKIAATKRSTGHYFLESFLSHYGMTLADVDLVDVDASKLRDSLETGKVDAITSWEPHIHDAEKSMGEDALTLLISPTPFRKDFFFTVNKVDANEKKESIQRFLSALIDAEKFIEENPEQSKKIVAQRIGASMHLIDRIWPSFIFEITLEQSILVHLEDEAQWAMTLSNEKTELPNYLNFIDVIPLSEIKPNGVSLIH